MDEPDVGSAFEHVGGAGVAEQVTTAGALESGFFECGGDLAAEDVGVECAAVTGQEQGLLGGIKEEAGAGFGEVAGGPVGGAVADGDDAVFAPFAFADAQGAALRAEVADAEPGKFGAADARPLPTSPSHDPRTPSQSRPLEANSYQRGPRRGASRRSQ